MDTYDMEVECGMYCQGGSVKGVLEPYGYGSWVKVEDAETLTAERDRLAAENAELRSSRPAETAYLDLSNRQLIIDYEQALKGLAAADATLDRLREVVPKVLPPHMSWKDSLDGARAILYPPETTNDDR